MICHRIFNSLTNALHAVLCEICASAGSSHKCKSGGFYFYPLISWASSVYANSTAAKVWYIVVLVASRESLACKMYGYFDCKIVPKLFCTKCAIREKSEERHKHRSTRSSEELWTTLNNFWCIITINEKKVQLVPKLQLVVWDQSKIFNGKLQMYFCNNSCCCYALTTTSLQ